GGPAVAEFEEAFAQFCAVGGCVGVANGTEAVMLALMGAGVDGRHTVVVPSYTFVATAEAVSHLGAKVKLVDCDPDTFNISVDALREIDDPNVKAVIPVHLYGQPADMGPIMEIAKEKGWGVVEDCAQAHGATYDNRPVGGIGDFGAFSFYPGKNMGAMGDAGAVTGAVGPELERVRRVSNHGRLGRYEHSEIGVNSRLDAIQAMALQVKLRHIADWNAARMKVAQMYRERLRGVEGLTLPVVHERCSHVYHLFVTLVEDREGLGQALAAQNIGYGNHYPIPLHLQPAYAHLGLEKGALPVSERVASQCISLPMFPELSEEQIDRVCAVVRDFMQAGG
ncbi:MAG: DegT/DnrJ/EryC1/StrS family aminotransferase, partial [Myxococcota bacterium]